MRWNRGHVSPNVEDRRGVRAGRGMGRVMPLSLGGVVLLLVLSLVFGRDLLTPLMGGGDAGTGTPAVGPQGQALQDELGRFASFVFDDAQNAWRQRMGGSYRDARMVLFSDAVETACGVADSSVGPFYCPRDERVYIDLSFYEQLRRRFGAPGDFAQAYVIAHEVGHHVQHITGVDDRMRMAQQASPERENELSVRLELQADCFAGVWANSTQQRQLLETGDLEEALGAAAAIGDDRIQRQTSGRVRPETWTHGSAEQRAAWFRRGLANGDPAACNTFD